MSLEAFKVYYVMHASSYQLSDVLCCVIRPCPYIDFLLASCNADTLHNYSIDL